MWSLDSATGLNTEVHTWKSPDLGRAVLGVCQNETITNWIRVKSLELSSEINFIFTQYKLLRENFDSGLTCTSWPVSHSLHVTFGMRRKLTTLFGTEFVFCLRTHTSFSFFPQRTSAQGQMPSGLFSGNFAGVSALGSFSTTKHIFKPWGNGTRCQPVLHTISHP